MLCSLCQYKVWTLQNVFGLKSPRRFIPHGLCMSIHHVFSIWDSHLGDDVSVLSVDLCDGAEVPDHAEHLVDLQKTKHTHTHTHFFTYVGLNRPSTFLDFSPDLHADGKRSLRPPESLLFTSESEWRLWRSFPAFFRPYSYGVRSVLLESFTSKGNTVSRSVHDVNNVERVWF